MEARAYSGRRYKKCTRNSLDSQGTLSTCTRHLSRHPSIFLPCKRFAPGYSASRGKKTAVAAFYSNSAFDVNFPC